MRKFLVALGALCASWAVAGCATQRPASQAQIARADGTVSAGTRSALDGDTGPGKQELIGLYIPMGPFALKAGVEWDGTTLLLPQAPQSIPLVQQQSACAPLAPQAAPCTQFVDVQEQVTEYEQQTVMVPQTRSVPVQRTRVVRRALGAVIPTPQAAPCAPLAPQAAPQGCPTPPVSQTSSTSVEERPVCVGAECVPPDLELAAAR